MLTPADYTYLKRNGRRFKQTVNEARRSFDAAEIPPLDAFVRFQTKFAGYKPDEDVTHGIVDPNVTKNQEVRQDNLGGKIRVRCDLDNLSQIRHWLDENGEFYYEDDPVAVVSSIRKIRSHDL